MEDKFDYVKEQLKKRAEQRQLLKVAQGSDVSRRVIGNILEGKDSSTRTVDKLYTFLKTNARKKML